MTISHQPMAQIRTASIPTLGEWLRALEKGQFEVAFLVTSGRNGCNLIQSLLDGHPEVLMIPTI